MASSAESADGGNGSRTLQAVIGQANDPPVDTIIWLGVRVVAEVLEATHAVVKLSLRQGTTVTFPGFGTFYTRERGERTVRNIQTGEPMTIPAGRQAAFRAGEHLKHAVSLTPRRRGRRPLVTDAAA